MLQDNSKKTKDLLRWVRWSRHSGTQNVDHKGFIIWIRQTILESAVKVHSHGHGSERVRSQGDQPDWGRKNNGWAHEEGVKVSGARKGWSREGWLDQEEDQEQDNFETISTAHEKATISSNECEGRGLNKGIEPGVDTLIKVSLPQPTGCDKMLGWKGRKKWDCSMRSQFHEKLVMDALPAFQATLKMNHMTFSNKLSVQNNFPCGQVCAVSKSTDQLPSFLSIKLLNCTWFDVRGLKIHYLIMSHDISVYN